MEEGRMAGDGELKPETGNLNVGGTPTLLDYFSTFVALWLRVSFCWF